MLARGRHRSPVFRAAMIIGSGSASFEILRYLAERLPVLITPRWVRTECQPIAIRNVLHYLVQSPRASPTPPAARSRSAARTCHLRTLLQLMAEERGLRRA